MNSEFVKSMQTAVKSQLDLFNQILLLQNKLEKSLEDGASDFAKVMDLLEKKNQFLDETKELSKKNAPILNQWLEIPKEERSSLDGEKIRQTLDELETKVVEIRDRDLGIMSRFEAVLNKNSSPQNMLNAWRAMN